MLWRIIRESPGQMGARRRHFGHSARGGLLRRSWLGRKLPHSVLREALGVHLPAMNVLSLTPDSWDVRIFSLIAGRDDLTFSVPKMPDYGVVEIPIR